MSTIERAKRVIKKPAALGAVAVIGLLGGGVAACGGNSQPNPNATTTELPANLGEKTFVSTYGERYTDPVSTYYADQAYKKANHGRDLVMTDTFINNYDKTAERPAVSDLGFSWCELPKDAKFDQATSIKLFNGYVAKEMTLAMNYWAKNSSDQAVAITDFEVTHYCSDASWENYPNSKLDFTADDAPLATMIDTFKGVAEKYGSTANFTVMPGKVGEYGSDTPNVTNFYSGDSTTIWAPDAKGKPTAFSNQADIAISIDIYNGKNVTHTSEVLKSVELSFMRNPMGNPTQSNSTGISIGQLPH
jgi:hypothetical protein